MAAKKRCSDKKAPLSGDTAIATTKEEDAVVDEPALPLPMRMAMIAATSILAEKGWRNREVVTVYLYNDNQSPTEQAMISVFAYIVLMGALFLSGFLLSILTNALKHVWFRKA
ncbi:hypothetical protein ACHHYP_20500 [Achlya hypogyna]|uniref:Transmembrane protein n=1 Tax=Achlya hypogyna TaxID=1202772 RepID=A0A1V9ZI89_ACHHY|nr:hypothetical protein ACHHYP_20500 [Achlya hypogyna]